MTALSDARLFTIGHSNHPIEGLLALLQRHAITAVADVRSSPFSRMYPQFNRESLAQSLREQGIRYVFLGDELGARRSEPECYDDATAKYDLIATAPLFRKGLDRVKRGLNEHRIALLCAEKDPLTCHRAILICRHLRGEVNPIHHILDDGSLETHFESEMRLLDLCDLPEQDLFRSREELIELAYEIQGDKIAYVASVAGDERV